MMKRLFYRFKNQFVCKECTLIDKSKRRYPDIPMLNERLLKNCKVVGHRDQLLQYLPKNSVCAEIGIETGKTSKKILEILQPSKLHLIEINEAWIENAKQLFPKEVASNKVILHHGSLKNYPNLKTTILIGFILMVIIDMTALRKTWS